MSAKVRMDGTFDFGSADKGLLSIESVTRHAMRIFADQYAKSAAIERQMQIRQLRASCGDENPPMKITMHKP